MTDSFLLFLPQARLDQYLYKDITFWHVHIYVRWVILLLIFHSQLLLCLWIQISLSASRGLTPRRVWWVQQSRTSVLKKGLVSKCSIVAILSMVNYCTRDGSRGENLNWRRAVNFLTNGLRGENSHVPKQCLFFTFHCFFRLFVCT
jgi:hypothetical protein